VLRNHRTADRPCRFALDGAPFTVQILLREKLVGSVYNFSTPLNSQGGIDGCENCLRQQQSKTLSSGQVTLTDALLACVETTGSGLTTLKKDDVRPYLKDNLRWRVLIVRRLPLAPYLIGIERLTPILSAGWGHRSPTVGDPVPGSFCGGWCS
jgi:hypothetical protein